jgi:hypothetical protein
LNSTGRGALLYNNGSTSVTLDDCRLVAIQLPPNKVTIFFVGNQTHGGGLGLPFSDGLLCVKAKRRYPLQVSNGAGIIDVIGVVTLTANLITPGSTWYFQAWYRDPTGPCLTGANFTNGLAVTFTP